MKEERRREGGGGNLENEVVAGVAFWKVVGDLFNTFRNRELLELVCNQVPQEAVEAIPAVGLQQTTQAPWDRKKNGSLEVKQQTIG